MRIALLVLCELRMFLSYQVEQPQTALTRASGRRSRKRKKISRGETAVCIRGGGRHPRAHPGARAALETSPSVASIELTVHRTSIVTLVSLPRGRRGRVCLTLVVDMPQKRGPGFDKETLVRRTRIEICLWIEIEQEVPTKAFAREENLERRIAIAGIPEIPQADEGAR